MSAAREMEKSAQAPRKPEIRPSTVPMTTATSVALIATMSENVSPSTTRDSVSRPVPGSTPSGCVHEMPPNGPIG